MTETDSPHEDQFEMDVVTTVNGHETHLAFHGLPTTNCGARVARRIGTVWAPSENLRAEVTCAKC